MAVYKRDIVDINLETGNIHRSFLKHSIGYKDQKADHFGIRTYRDGVPVDLTGVSVQGIFLPPQGDPIAITSGNIVDGNVAEVVLPQACYNYDGQFTLSIKLVDSNNSVTGTMRIVDGMVDNTHASGTVAPTSAVPTYQEILSTYDEMVAATTAANTAATNCASIVAAAYSTSATYAVGDYCTKDGKLYRCTTAITTAESWTAGHWAETKVGPEVSDLKSAIDEQSSIVSTNLMGIDVQQNLYPGAVDWSGEWTASDAVNIINSTALFNGYPAMRSKTSWNRYFRLIPITAGKTYTFEAWIKCDVAGSIFAYATWPNHVDNVATISANSKQVNNIPANTWTKITFTFSCTASGNIGPFVLCSSGAFDFAHYVLVEGNSVFSLSEELNKKADKTDVDALAGKVDCIKTHTNILDGLTVTQNKVYERTTANVVDNEYANIYPTIPVESGKTYYYRNLYAYFCVIKYSDNTSVNLSSSTDKGQNGSFTASGNGYIYISVANNRTGFVFTEDSLLYNSGLTESFATIDVQNIPTIYHVEKDGSGDFDSLVEAIEEATKYMDSVVYVGAGTWDLIDELGSDYINSVSSSKRGVYLKNRVHLIFDPKAIVSCVYEGTRSDTIAWLSAFNAGVNGFTLENANIITGNIRYCVHDERDQDTDFYTNHYINCTMYHDSSYAQGGQNQCIGGGLGLNGHIIVEGCVFENPNVNNAAVVSWHNSAGSNAKSFIDVHGCYVKGTNSMRFRYYGSTPATQKTIILCHDNCLGANVGFGPETSGSTNENMELLQWNNEIRT